MINDAYTGNDHAVPLSTSVSVRGVIPGATPAGRLTPGSDGAFRQGILKGMMRTNPVIMSDTASDWGAAGWRLIIPV